MQDMNDRSEFSVGFGFFSFFFFFFVLYVDSLKVF